MELREEVAAIKQQGMEKAAAIWEILEMLPQPIDPVNIYKAACSVKSAEFAARIRHNSLFRAVMELLAGFMEETILIAGESGSQAEGMRVIELFEQEMPLSREVYDDPAAYATRQHVYDGIIMLAAAKLGKEQETIDALRRFQRGVEGAMVLTLIKESLLELAKEQSPEDENDKD